MRKKTTVSFAYRKTFAAGIIAAVLLLSSGPLAFAWSDRDYAAHDHRSFGNLPAARARIDMRRIDYPLLNAALFYETNRERAAQGKKPFRHSPALGRAAQGHSEDMARLGFMSHKSRVPGKKVLEDRLVREGLRPGVGTWGENIGMVFGIEYKSGARVYPPNEEYPFFRYRPEGEPLRERTYIGLAQEAVREWMSSPGHRSNILNDAFQELGTGAAHYTDPGFFGMDMFKVTQNFYGAGVPARQKR